EPRRLSQPLEDDEADLALLILLIPTHDLNERIEIGVLIGRRQPNAAQNVPVPVHELLVDETGGLGQLSLEHHPHAHGLTMPPAVVLLLLDRVAEGVPVVEDLPDIRLLEVLGYHVSLDLDGPLDQLREYVTCRVQRLVRIFLVDLNDALGSDEAGLNDFCGSRDQLL